MTKTPNDSKTILPVRLLRLFSSKTAIGLIVIVLVAGYFTGRAAMPIVQQVREAMVYADIGGGVEPYEHLSNMSPEYNKFMSWLSNDLAKQREPWSVDDASILMRILDARYTQEYVENYAFRPDASVQDMEPVMKFGNVHTITAVRLRRNEPIDPEARAMLVLAMTDALEDPYWDIRLGIVASVCDARLVTDPKVRAKVVAMYDDPNDLVASNAKNQLAWFDETERLRAEGKWHEPWIKD